MGIFHYNGKCALIALSLLVNFNLKAQDNIEPVEIRSLTKIRFTFFGVGLEREQKIGPILSIYLGASISTVYLFEPTYLKGRAPDVFNLQSVLGYSPVFYTGIRKYYDLNERQKDKKKTLNNSANYIGLQIGAIPSIEINHYKTSFNMSLVPHWGMQRSLGKKANFEFALGPAIRTNFDVLRVVPFSKIGFSVLL